MKKFISIICSFAIIFSLSSFVYAIDDTNQNNKYEYITKNISDSYWKNDGTLLGEIDININFRLNKITKEVKCLSISHKTKNVDEKCKLKTFARTHNMKTTHGGALICIDVRPSIGKGSAYKNEIKVTCDSNGEINIEKNVIN